MSLLVYYVTSYILHHVNTSLVIYYIKPISLSHDMHNYNYKKIKRKRKLGTKTRVTIVLRNILQLSDCF